MELNTSLTEEQALWLEEKAPYLLPLFDFEQRRQVLRTLEKKQPARRAQYQLIALTLQLSGLFSTDLINRLTQSTACSMTGVGAACLDAATTRSMTGVGAA